MESAEPFPSGAVRAPDLAEHLDRSGPFVSVYLHTDPDIENAGRLAGQRWKTLRSELEEMKVSAETLDRIDAEVPDAHTRGRVLGVIADADGALHVEHGDPFQPQDLGRVDPLPYLLPMIRWRQTTPAILVVLIDRTGADLFAIARGVDESREVSGPEETIRKVSAGGWSMRRYQERAENAWERNAENVAEALQAMARRFEPRRIAVAGDVRAVSLLEDSLSHELRPLVVQVSGDRPHGEKGDPIPDGVADLVTEIVASETQALSERLRQELGEDDLGAQGINDVVAALARAQVETLLIAEDPDDGSNVWIGEKPPQLASSAEDLRALGVDEPRAVRSRDAIVAAALATDAGVRILDAGTDLEDGVGALLRWRNGDGASP